MHLIDKHMFPKQYDFFVVDDGIDHKSSMLRSGRHKNHRYSSAAQMKSDEVRQSIASSELTSSKQGTEGNEATTEANDPSMFTEDNGMKGLQTESPVLEPEDVQMKGLETAMSSLRFVPSSVRFGRGRGRGRGFSRS